MWTYYPPSIHQALSHLLTHSFNQFSFSSLYYTVHTLMVSEQYAIISEFFFFSFSCCLTLSLSLSHFFSSLTFGWLVGWLVFFCLFSVLPPPHRTIESEPDPEPEREPEPIKAEPKPESRAEQVPKTKLTRKPKPTEIFRSFTNLPRSCIFGKYATLHLSRASKTANNNSKQ